MAGLVLHLREGETLIINGAVIRFAVRSRIELESRARFVFGKQVMAPEHASTPLSRLYLMIQDAYVGEDKVRAGALADARSMAVEIAATCDTHGARAQSAVDQAESGCFFEALNCLRAVLAPFPAPVRAAAA